MKLNKIVFWKFILQKILLGNKLISYLIIIGISSSFATANTTVKLKSSIIASDGDKVPMIVKISPPLKSGDRLSIFSNNSLVATITSDGNFKYDYFKTNIKMIKSGYISIEVELSNGQKYTEQRKLTIKKIANIVEKKTNGKIYRQETKGKNIKTIIQGYSNKVLIKTNTGSILIKPTKYISDDIFLSIKGNNDYSNVLVKIPSTTNNPSSDSDVEAIGVAIVTGAVIYKIGEAIFGGGEDVSSSPTSNYSSSSSKLKTYDCSYQCRTSGFVLYDHAEFTMTVQANENYQAESKVEDYANDKCNTMKGSTTGLRMWDSSIHCEQKY